MSVPRSVAVVFDTSLRPDTTGVHCYRALSQLTKVTHVPPSQLHSVARSDFDLFLRIDDGIPLDWPTHLRPSACWLIDTHMDFSPRLSEAANFDLVFAAQMNGAQRLRAEGISQAEWLPLACSPDLHRRHEVPNQWEIGFVGNLRPHLRASMIALLSRRYPRSFFGQAYEDDLAKTYSASHVAFNCAVSDDVNMRVFEAMGCGTALFTNDLSENGQGELFRDGLHLITYAEADDLLDKMAFFLTRDEPRIKIARQGQAEVYERHTYLHRMQRILEIVQARPKSSLRSAVASQRQTDSIPDDLVNQVDVVIKTFLRPKALLQLLRSIRQFYSTLQITVADDGGIESATDQDSMQCVTFIRDDPYARLLALPFAAGVSAGRNLLIEKTQKPFLLFLDDDFVVTGQTRIERLFERITAEATLGVAAGVCIDLVGERREVRRSGGTLHIQDGVLHHHTTAWRDQSSGLCDYFPTFALVRRSLLEQGVQWRGGIGGEHYDFCLQVQRSGWQALIDSSAQIDHDRQIESDPRYAAHRLDYQEAQQWLLETWDLQRIVQDGQTICERTTHLSPDHIAGAAVLVDQATHFTDTNYFHFSRPDVLALVPHTAKRVLDIGCGAGRLGEAIKIRQPAEVLRIEANTLAAKSAATRLDQVFCVDIETSEWPFPEEHFDCVIVADVLEHLQWPERVLAKIRRSLRAGGVLVASLPNTRNHSVLSGLLEGHWTYEAAGLLDKTHLRFFTRREIEKLFYRAGYQLSQWYVKPDEMYEEWHQAGRPGKIRIGSLHIEGLTPEEAEEFYAYQFLMVAQPSPKPKNGLTSIIILTHNQLACTRLCLDSIRMRTDEPYELIIVDNGSTDGTAEYLRALSGIHLIENRENQGFPAGVNQGLRVARGEQVLMLNNDTIVTTGWLTRMLACLNSGSNIGLVGPVSNRISGIQCIPVSYDALNTIDGFAWEWGKANADKQIEADRLVGFCLLAKRSLINTIGGLDERFGLGNFEDDDYCLRAIEAGYRCVVAVDSFVHHFGSQSFRTMGEGANELLKRNQEQFVEKWRDRRESSTAKSAAANITSVREPRFETERAENGGIALKRRESTSPARVIADTQAKRRSAEPLSSPVQILQKRFAWPERKPDFAVPEAVEGWLMDGPREALRATLSARTELVIELGSWLGMSTRWIADCAPRAHVIAIDHFQGSKEHHSKPALAKHLPRLYEGFLSRCWDYRSRIIPIRATTTDGMRIVADAGVCPDVVYVDASHEYDAVALDLKKAWSCFPEAVLVGDDYADTAVQKAVDEFADVHGASVEVFGTDWPAWRLKPTCHPAPTDVANARLAGQAASISLCMIVRDNEKTLDACLSSIKPWVNELIVVDTGSNDHTPQIARNYGAKVFHHPWPDSFAAARNDSLRYATGDWIFWMDSDDTITPENGRKLRERLSMKVIVNRALSRSSILPRMPIQVPSSAKVSFRRSTSFQPIPA